MTSLTVREAKLEDAATIARLNEVVQRLHFEAHPDRFHEPNASSVEPVYREMLALNATSESPSSRAWLCEDVNDGVVGYVLAFVRERADNPFTKAFRCVELDQIAVLEEARGRGAGRLLLGPVVEWAQSLKVDVIELSVWDFNDRSREFFDSIGFASLAHRKAIHLPTG
jgi:GNAT superfamily N-acetyltransferase